MSANETDDSADRDLEILRRSTESKALYSTTKRISAAAIRCGARASGE
jgi:hypothetical protein